MNNEPKNLGNRIHLIDGYDLNMPYRTGSYIIDEDDLTIIETGPSPSVPYILEGLQKLHFNPSDVKYIIVTHIHLDHSGGVGQLLQDCPHATVIVHPKGARHLIDPSRLKLGAKAVYGDDFDQLFEPVVPVPEEKVMIKADQETLAIGKDCTLTFYDTPGHADHHFSIYDPVSNGMFTGDTIGIQYELLNQSDVDLFIPSTSPNQFKPEAMIDSLKLVQSLEVERIFFGHFGMTEKVDHVYEQVQLWLARFLDIGEQVHANGGDSDEAKTKIVSIITDYLQKQNVPANHPVYGIIALDASVSAMGLIDYFNKKQRKS